MLCQPLMDEKAHRYGSHAAFAADARIVSDAAARQAAPGEPTAAVTSEVRARWLVAKLAALAQAVPADLIAVIGRTGGGAQALGLAELVPDTGDRALAYIAAGAELIRAGHAEPGRQALSAALGLMKVLPAFGAGALLPVIDAYASLRDVDGLNRAAGLMSRASGEQVPAAIAALARGYASSNAAEHCAEWARRLPLTDGCATAVVCRALLQVGRSTEALDIARQVASHVVQAPALAAVALALVDQGRLDEGAELAIQALQDAPASAAGDAVKALARAGQARLAEDLVSRLSQSALVTGALTLAVAAEVPAEAVRLARRALEAIVGPDDRYGPSTADLLRDAAPFLGEIGDGDLVRRAFSAAVALPDDGYGSAAPAIGSLAEAFAKIGDVAGIDTALAAATTIGDDTFAGRALVGVARACVDANHRIDAVRAAGRSLHRHFLEPWAIDVEVAFSLAEAGRAQDARELANSVLDELQVTDDIDATIAWRLAVADALTSSGRPEAAAALCADGLKRGEGLAVSGDEEYARRRAPYLMQLAGAEMTFGVAEGMEWRRVVDVSAPILPVLARTGEEDLLRDAIQRLSDLAYAGWPLAESFAALAGPAAEALLVIGRPDESAQVLERLAALGARGQVLASSIWVKLVPKFLADGAADLAAEGARQVLEAASRLDEARLFSDAAIVLDAVGLERDAASALGKATDPEARLLMLQTLAQQAIDRGDMGRATQLVEELLGALDSTGMTAVRVFSLASAARALAQLGDRARARSLTEQVLSLANADDFGQVSLLPEVFSRLACAAVDIADREAFRRILDAAAGARDKYWGRRAVTRIALAASDDQAGWLTLVLGEDSAPQEIREELRFAWATALDASGEAAQAVLEWRQAWSLQRDARVGKLAERFRDGAELLAHIDGGATLQQIANALSEVDAWWPSGPWRGSVLQLR